MTQDPAIKLATLGYVIGDQGPSASDK
jgi:hypothetical protein